LLLFKKIQATPDSSATARTKAIVPASIRRPTWPNATGIRERSRFIADLRSSGARTEHQKRPRNGIVPEAGDALRRCK